MSANPIRARKASTTSHGSGDKPVSTRSAIQFCGVLFSVAIALCGFEMSHDFHFSRTDMRWNTDTRTIQTTLRIFTDDLELALRNHRNLPSEFKIWLGDDEEWTSADDAIFDWVEANLTIQLDDSTLAWNWVGKEIDLDVSYIYLESMPIDARGAIWTVMNRLFFNEYEDQVNEVYLERMNSDGSMSERREMLNWELPSFVWDGTTPEPENAND